MLSIWASSLELYFVCTRVASTLISSCVLRPLFALAHASEEALRSGEAHECQQGSAEERPQAPAPAEQQPPPRRQDQPPQPQPQHAQRVLTSRASEQLAAKTAEARQLVAAFRQERDLVRMSPPNPVVTSPDVSERQGAAVAPAATPPTTATGTVPATTFSL